jgi:hypothetical protein
MTLNRHWGVSREAGVSRWLPEIARRQSSTTSGPASHAMMRVSTVVLDARVRGPHRARPALLKASSCGTLRRMQCLVNASRYKVLGIRVVQATWPMGMLASILARRLPSEALQTLAWALLISGFLAFVVSRKAWRRVPIKLEGRRLQSICFDGELHPAQVPQWSFDRGVARLHGTRVSWKLTCKPDDEAVLSEMLTRALGDRVPVKPLGSPRARRLALVAAAMGLIASVAGVALELVPLFCLGVIAVVLGAACYGAFGTRVDARKRQDLS